jgi:hypothetical protein
MFVDERRMCSDCSDTRDRYRVHLNEFFIYLQIERLCDRIQSATRLEDRRDAVRALKALSKVINNSILISASGSETIVFGGIEMET